MSAAELPPLTDDEAARVARLAATLDARRATEPQEPSPGRARDAS